MIGMQCSGSHASRCAEAAVERVGDVECLRVHDDDRVDRRSRLVVCRYAREVLADQLAACETAARHRGVNFRDRRFLGARTLGGDDLWDKRQRE